jgi:hypothetical protein
MENRIWQGLDGGPCHGIDAKGCDLVAFQPSARRFSLFERFPAHSIPHNQPIALGVENFFPFWPVEAELGQVFFEQRFSEAQKQALSG